jgi:hypothetical protein
MKQLIILIAYINIKNMASYQAHEEMNNFKKSIFDLLKNVDKETNIKIKTLMIPTQESETRVECIFPKEPNLPEEISKKLNEIENKLKEYDSIRLKN